MLLECVEAEYIPGDSYCMNRCKKRPKGALRDRGGNGTYICKCPAEINITLEGRNGEKVVHDVAKIARRVAYERNTKLSKGMAKAIAKLLQGRKLNVLPNGNIENLHDEIDDIVRNFKRIK